MIPVDLRVHLGETVAAVPPRLFGGFVEHMGRCVYQGIYEPGHPSADAHGFREDVLELVRELGVTVARYPGGNFVSGYRWEDGVGPLAQRPVRLEAAWHSTETNEVGLHEFAGWADRAGVEVMQAVNLGTRGVLEAGDLLEYSNHPSGTALSEQRRTNGADEPFGITLWCLGNEMDGPWQIGHKTADEYGRLAAETARYMRFLDHRVELVVAGSSNMEMPTFGEWERTVLRHTAELADHISVHAYYEESDGDVASFLASGAGLDRYLDTVAGIIDEVLLELGLDKKIGISVDEWNVWYQRDWNENHKDAVLSGDWPQAPRLIEDEYNVTDAVVVGSLLISLLRHSDRVSMANLAQLVNVIAPIRCEPDGSAWRQTTFFPFALTSARGRGRVVRSDLTAPTVGTSQYGDVDMVDAVSVVADDGCVSLFVVNRSTTETVSLTTELTGASLILEDAQVLTVPEGGDRFSTNTQTSQPVAPVALDGVHCSTAGDTTRLSITLPPISWSVLTLRPAAAVKENSLV
ncbi:alpha-L-arabinofuranosidase C-terminal domain-containing protein [Kineosporia sp. NBRC 101731]|uniref:arabinosylfuranosidase ArfA n=1 Tax=Kineosporia sp. NBRC 101731 TaxID=3032199 RepID=UPI0024A09B6A|nr:alpha-L-arabinofuranosidase C-terminal domain-containing protein [Kineosporia sp. NBRC 101731]GLY32759.1 alpha-N-arabinofuranosidase [Kineosporia sp. NBRC 101731]